MQSAKAAAASACSSDKYAAPTNARSKVAAWVPESGQSMQSAKVITEESGLLLVK